MVFWVLWNNRNNCVWNGEKEADRSVGIKASVLWNEWQEVQLIRSSNNNANQPQQIDSSLQWQKPPFGWHKCNVDAAFHKKEMKTSAGWCVRDHTGQFVMAGTSWNQGRCSIIEGEAIALLEAMTEAARRGITNVIFETDSKIVVDAIQNLHRGFSEFNSIICNIQSYLSFNSNFKVKFAKRQANMVAHKLARAAISWASRYYLERIPTCIETILINEMF
ncbi:unnamed protein product [Trifolium pratense]|uniref:Uncharacterized protein n=1 Tax=Trifolium pratense TaxID=57577 RepID=A0ACB0JLS3_TRIPR|nr:unnamed protein product [Trifolium pratense]